MHAHARRTLRAPPAQGVLYLDDLTFGRVVNGRDDVLVRFDEEYR